MTAKYPIVLSLAALLAIGCSKEKNSDIIDFDESRVYLILEDSYAGDPCWSPDMTTVVYTSGGNLWAIPPEKSEPTQVTSLPGPESYPNWSPVAGSRDLVFVNASGADESTIYTLRYGQGEPVEVITVSGIAAATSFSRDGSLIVFLRPGKKGIFTIPVGGGEITTIPNDQGWQSVEFAQASPARDAVIFIDRTSSAYRINSINLDGSGFKTVISLSGGREQPSAVAESYDGATIAYTSPGLRPGSNLLFISPDGGLPKPLTWFSYAILDHPTWAFDGSRVITEFDEGLYLVEPKE